MRENLQKYIDLDALSYSKLSSMLFNPKTLVIEDKKKGEGLKRGSLLDCIVFTPEEFDSSFYVMPPFITKPSGAMGAWLDAFLDIELPPDFKLNEIDDIILQARNICKYNMTLTDKVALSKFHAECDRFLSVVAEAGDRTIVTHNEHEAASDKLLRLLTNEFVSDYFSKSKFQVDLYGNINGVDVKILLDGLWIDEDKKTVLPWDLKNVGESVHLFERDFIKWRYWIQAGLYREIVSQNYPGYKILPFTFIVISDYEQPVAWVVDNKLHSICMNGGDLRSGRTIRGVYALIEDYKWHKENKLYEYTAELYRSRAHKNISIL